MRATVIMVWMFVGLFGAMSHAAKPNIVLILADDVGADMFSCYGQPQAAKTPNIDRLAEEGVQFETCFAPAICGPSRALIMTGV
jgi:arylsulfatase A